MAASILQEILSSLNRFDKFPFNPEEFSRIAAEVFSSINISVDDISDYLTDSWDEFGCDPSPVDFGEGPIVVSLHNERNWCLRATIWPAGEQSPWRDKVHNHFGFITTTAVTEIAYDENIYASFESISRGGENRRLIKGVVHIIGPGTIHRIVPLLAIPGISISVRTRAVRSKSQEYDESAGLIVDRTRAAFDEKQAIKSILKTL